MDLRRRGRRMGSQRTVRQIWDRASASGVSPPGLGTGPAPLLVGATLRACRRSKQCQHTNTMRSLKGLTRTRRLLSSLRTSYALFTWRISSTIPHRKLVYSPSGTSLAHLSHPVRRHQAVVCLDVFVRQLCGTPS